MPQNTRHDLRCPNCQRFIENEPDGFYDRLGSRENETSWVAPFCNEGCADDYHEKRREHLIQDAISNAASEAFEAARLPDDAS